MLPVHSNKRPNVVMFVVIPIHCVFDNARTYVPGIYASSLATFASSFPLRLWGLFCDSMRLVSPRGSSSAMDSWCGRAPQCVRASETRARACVPARRRQNDLRKRISNSPNVLQPLPTQQARHTSLVTGRLPTLRTAPTGRRLPPSVALGPR